MAATMASMALRRVGRAPVVQAARRAAAPRPALLQRPYSSRHDGHTASKDAKSLKFLTRAAIVMAVPTAAIIWSNLSVPSKGKPPVKAPGDKSKSGKIPMPAAVAAADQMSRPEPLPSAVAPLPSSEPIPPVPSAGEETAPAAATAAESAPVTPPPAPLDAAYVLVGAGTATASALRAIRKKDPKAQVLIIGDEPEAPYMRPPLSKELWFSEDPSVTETLRFKDWSGNEKSLFFESADSLDMIDGTSPLPPPPEEGKARAAVLTGRRAVELDLERQVLTLDNGQEVRYGKILLATGGVPRELGITKGLAPEIRKHVVTYRKVSDFRALKSVIAPGKHVAIIGGGFLGSELACALARQIKANPDLRVTQIFPEEGNRNVEIDRIRWCQWCGAGRREQMGPPEGVHVLPKTSVVGIHEAEADGQATGRVALSLSSGEDLVVDHVVVAVGIEPNVELARSAGLEIDESRGGVMVNAELEARSNVFAAGDVVSYHDISLGRRRVEHHDHAVMSGRFAGENMTGARKPYSHQSMFWSDLGPQIGYEAVGILDSRLTTVGIWAKTKTPAANAAAGEQPATGTALEGERADAPATSAAEAPAVVNTDDFGKGAVFYLRNKRVVGVLMWNLYDRVPVARQIIKEAKVYDDFNELAKLMRVHE